MIITQVVGLQVETLCQKAPPLVPVAKINGTVHRFHAPFLQPVPAGIHQQVCRLLIIDAFKKAHSACRLFIFPVQAFSVYKGGHSSDGLVILPEYPADAFPVSGVLTYRDRKSTSL